MILLYNFLLSLTSFFWLPWMIFRARKRKEMPDWSQRAGDVRMPAAGTNPKRIWLHAVSVGEVMASLPVLADLKKRLPGWEIVLSPEIHLGPRPDRLVPDLAGWRRERLPDEVAPGGASRYYDVAPDWVCEVLWSGTKGVDRGKKMRIYRREGVRHVWLIDPIERFLEVFQLEEMGYFQLDIYDEENAVVRAEPFNAIEIPLGALWGGQAAIS